MSVLNSALAFSGWSWTQIIFPFIFCAKFAFPITFVRSLQKTRPSLNKQDFDGLFAPLSVFGWKQAHQRELTWAG